MAERLATGFFPVHFSGGTPNLRLYFRNYSRQSHKAAWQVSQTEAGGKVTVLARGTVSTAPGSMHEVIVPDVQGRTVQIQVRRPSDFVVITAACVGTFIADGAEQILVYIPATDFIARDGVAAAEQHAVSPGTQAEKKAGIR